MALEHKKWCWEKKWRWAHHFLYTVFFGVEEKKNGVATPFLVFQHQKKKVCPTPKMCAQRQKWRWEKSPTPFFCVGISNAIPNTIPAYGRLS